MAIIQTYYIRILKTKPERKEMILMDNETGLPAEFATKGHGERWMVQNEKDLIPGALYDVTEAFKTDREE